MSELARLQKLGENARIGGKGTVRRKRKVEHKTSAVDDRNLMQFMKRFGVAPVAETDEVNFFTDDNKVMSFEHPKVYGNVQSQVYVVSGKHDMKRPEDVETTSINFQELAALASRAGMGGAGGAVPGLEALDA